MSESVITEELIRQCDPASLQHLLIDEIERGTMVFRVKPDGVSWTEFNSRSVPERFRPTGDYPLGTVE